MYPFLYILLFHLDGDQKLQMIHFVDMSSNVADLMLDTLSLTRILASDLLGLFKNGFDHDRFSISVYLPWPKYYYYQIVTIHILWTNTISIFVSVTMIHEIIRFYTTMRRILPHSPLKSLLSCTPLYLDPLWTGFGW